MRPPIPRVVVLLLVLTRVPALDAGDARATDGDPPIATDRPGNANAPTTVPAGRLQIETSVVYARDTSAPADTYSLNLPTALRYGLPGRTELRLGTGIVGIESTGGASDTEATDTWVGFKVQLLDNDRSVPNLGFVADVYLPTGDGAFTGDAVVPDVRLAASWSLPRSFGILVNAGADAPEDDHGRFGRFVYVVNATYAPRFADGRLSLFVEAYGRIAPSAGRDDVRQVDLGFSYLLSDDWQIDAFVQRANTEATPEWQLAFGLSTRLRRATHSTRRAAALPSPG